MPGKSQKHRKTAGRNPLTPARSFRDEDLRVRRQGPEPRTPWIKNPLLRDAF